jgi:hypothetical protein
MSTMVPSIGQQQRVLAGPSATALAVVLGLAIAIGGAFALTERGSAEPGAVHSVPEPNAALREGGPRTNPVGNEQYTPLHRATAE